MHIFASEWLKRMVLKSASKPESRLLNLFGIIEDWLYAPGIRESLVDLDHFSQLELQSLIQTLATDAQLSEPETLAFQLEFILIGAIAEELRNPGGKAMERAISAAKVVITAAKPAKVQSSYRLAAAAFGMFAVVIGAVTLMPTPMTSESASPTNFTVASFSMDDRVSSRPDRIVAIYQMHAKLQSGQCLYPQALMLAADQRAQFMDGVVNIDRLNISESNLDDVRKLYNKVDCSYAPAAMQL